MSRITISSASFSWARPAMRRACSSGVRVGSGPCASRRSLATGCRRSVQAKLVDHARDGRWDELVDRLAALDTATDLVGRDIVRRDLEELDPIRLRQPLEDRVEPLPRIARARRDAELHLAQHALRILPCREVAELVRADEEDRVAVAAAGDR